MKSLKNIVKRSPSPRNPQAPPQNSQGIASQRSKNNSQNLLRKYNQANIEMEKRPLSKNKYRIVTEPIDDHLSQLAKSYAKLAPQRLREGKFESQHTSIKGRQKSVSAERVIQLKEAACPFCRAYQNQLKVMREDIYQIINKKQMWKNGEMLIQEFAKDTAKYLQMNRQKEVHATIEDVRKNLLDLMTDIQALTDVDYPKLLSYNVFTPLQKFEVYEEEQEIKLLLNQLRDQTEGVVSIWDVQEDQNQGIRTILRNIKSNLCHCIRQNLELRTKLMLSKKDGTAIDEDIRRVVMEVLRGLKK